LHWNRGSPSDQGENINKTIWEQIDNGVQWTESKKFFMVVPIALFLIVCYATNWQTEYLVFNVVVLCILLIAKMPGMHGVRLFHINEVKTD
jgi:ORMDL family